MKEQLKLPLVIVAVLALVGFVFVLGKKAISAGDLDQGQIQYTPGVPPWQEKDPKKGLPGGPPPVNPATSQVPGTAPGAPTGVQASPGQGGQPLPPGMTPPVIDNGGAQGK